MTNRPHAQKRKAQSAMEYLMTYGWAILIIAIVLAALFSLGVFSSASALGTACIAGSPFICTSVTAFPENNLYYTANTLAINQLWFTVGQNSGSSMYNVEIICLLTANSSSSSAGTVFTGVAAYKTLNAVMDSLNQFDGGLGSTISTGQQFALTEVPCPSGPLPGSGANTVGTQLTGSIWINYTLSSSAAAVGTNPWLTAKVATFTAKVS